MADIKAVPEFAEKWCGTFREPDAEMVGHHMTEDRFLFRGTLQKIRIISNKIRYGPCPKPDDEVEQHLTINAQGRVWFSSYNFGDVPGKYQKANTRNFKIDMTETGKIFRAFSSYFGNMHIEAFTTDMGSWAMELTNTEGKTYRFSGSLDADFRFKGENLSDLIRDGLGMDYLYVFDGKTKPDKAAHIQLD